VTLRTQCVEETERFGERLAGFLAPGSVVGLVGPLGAGKTSLVRGIARGCGVDEREVHSPSFLTAVEYEGRLPVAHVDLYRHGEASPDPEWLAELLDGEGVAVVEWFEQLPGREELDALVVRISPGAGEQERTLEVSAQGERSADALQRLGPEVS
jgi:tRNA threonylcarbamoyladenosine biosynthesis protein TsaE